MKVSLQHVNEECVLVEEDVCRDVANPLGENGRIHKGLVCEWQQQNMKLLAHLWQQKATVSGRATYLDLGISCAAASFGHLAVLCFDDNLTSHVVTEAWLAWRSVQLDHMARSIIADLSQLANHSGRKDECQ